MLTSTFKRAVVMAAAVACSGALLVATAVAHSKGRRWVCRPGGRHVVVADTRAKVYLQLKVRRYGVPRLYRGCVFGSNRSYPMGVPPRTSESSQVGDGGTRRITLVGTVVAYEEFGAIYDPGGTESETKVYVRRLGDGRWLHKIPTGTPNPPDPLRHGIGATTALVLKRDGAVAWIVQTLEPEGSYQVHAVDGSGGRELAVGPDIAPYSLALAGGTLYWTQGGQPMSAKLE